MKRAWTYLLVLCLLLPCAADAAKAPRCVGRNRERRGGFGATSWA